ncbi:RBBP9/YdeN family alpha/beta hydrolase [Nitrosophilus alvini]|uniref:RBBP9/YdeN family alpha/beta hydrolase n=1 Tax=Nitrosophilus alvini TaxID=2714855 RepID=UPI001F1BDBFE|nr:alpha/beta hydrolase [Nitrosophilus alvini]
MLILHGWGGSDYPHWQSWLASELAKDYGTLSFPLLMHPHHPNRHRWMKKVKNIMKTFSPTTVICHSLACTLWFWLCNEGEVEEVQRLLLVAPPRLDCDIEIIKSFFPVETPKRLFAKEAMMVVSTNDPYMSIQEAHELQNFLNIEMLILENAGHINTDSGYGEWPWVLEWAKEGGKEAAGVPV